MMNEYTYNINGALINVCTYVYYKMFIHKYKVTFMRKQVELNRKYSRGIKIVTTLYNSNDGKALFNVI